jgi:parallel beta-helix repeat protein
MSRSTWTLALVLAASLAPAARAAESYDGCTGFVDSLPATIATQGVWCLRQDLATSQTTGYAVTVAANNVTIDCNDFKIGGQAAGAGTEARGIYASNRANVTVRNCNVRGFRHGIFLTGGASSHGHVVEGNRLDGNTYIGIWVYGDASVIRHNEVLSTGGSSLAYPTGISAGGQVHVLDNTVSGVTSAGAPDYSNTFGITTNNGIGTVGGNRISGLVPASSGSVYALHTSNPVRVVLLGNQAFGPGSGVGVSCGAGATTLVRARDNLFDGFTIGVSGCGDAGGNDVSP